MRGQEAAAVVSGKGADPFGTAASGYESGYESGYARSGSRERTRNGAGGPKAR